MRRSVYWSLDASQTLIAGCRSSDHCGRLAETTQTLRHGCTLLDALRSGIRSSPPSCGRRAPSSKRRRAWTPGSTPTTPSASLTRDGTFVFLTDSAVGSKEEDNLRHLVINLGSDVPRSKVVPFLTCKHTLDYCLAYADRAQQHGFESLVVLGGDKNVGQPRCVEHAWQLREAIRSHQPSLILGGWANPHADAASAGRSPAGRPHHTRSST